MTCRMLRKEIVNVQVRIVDNLRIEDNQGLLDEEDTLATYKEGERGCTFRR